MFNISCCNYDYGTNNYNYLNEKVGFKRPTKHCRKNSILLGAGTQSYHTVSFRCVWLSFGTLVVANGIKGKVSCLTSEL